MRTTVLRTNISLIVAIHSTLAETSSPGQLPMQTCELHGWYMDANQPSIMLNHFSIHTALVIHALTYFMIFVESTSNVMSDFTRFSTSGPLATAPHITAPPTSRQTELVKRQDFGFDTCAFINGKSSCISVVAFLC